MRISLLNRTEAGRLLAAEIKHYEGHPGLVVVGLPRGGVPVAFEVACALRAPLDVLVVRKLGLPGEKELAIGAIATGGVRVLDEALIRSFGIPRRLIEEITAEERLILDRRERLYRAGRPPLDLLHRTVIVVDDGVAMGATMRAAVKAVRQQKPDRVIVAAPVVSIPARKLLLTEADEVFCLATPEPFYAVGAWYEDFSQVSDEEVRRLLASSARQKVA